MRYPKFLSKNSTIGFACPSLGCPADPYRSRYDSAKKYFEEEGYRYVESPSVYQIIKAESNSEDIRAKELQDLYFNPNVDFIISNGGGELMCEILPYIDFNMIKKSEPKFFMGYSDNTNFTFTLTTICDIASIYGIHTCDFGMVPQDVAVKRALEVMKGERTLQESFPLYEKDWNGDNPLAPYNNTEPVEYKLIGSRKRFKGRLIGGCLDCLLMLLGTPFDHVKEFVKKYKEDGILWYIESCELNSLAVKRALWQLEQAGWFKYASGFIIGRPGANITPFDISYEEAIVDILGKYDLPIILNADIGHVSPTVTLINGSIMEIEFNDGKCVFKTTFKE